MTVRELIDGGRHIDSTSKLDIMFKIWWFLYSKYGQFLPGFMLSEEHPYRLDIPLDYSKISEIFNRFVQKLIVKSYPFVGSEGNEKLLKELEEFRQLYSLDNLNTDIRFIKILKDKYYEDCQDIFTEITGKKLIAPIFTISKPNLYRFSHNECLENNRLLIINSNKGENLKTFLKALNTSIEKRQN